MKLLRTLTLSVLLALFAVGFVVAAGTDEPAATGQETIPMRIFKPGLPETWPDDPLVAHWNEKFNIEIEFVSPSWSDWQQKRNLLLSTAAPMDIFTLVGDIQWVEEGALLELDDVLDPAAHEYLYKVCNSETYKGQKVEGKIYFIPGPNQGTTWGLGVRKDWMDALGLDMPQNEDDFASMLRAFKDMDSSGQTVGWAIEGGFAVRRSIFPLLLSYGVPTMMLNTRKSFFIENGKLTNVVETPEMKAGLKFLNELYLEGLINTDFASMNFPKINEKYFKSGKSGVGWSDFGGWVKTVTELGGEAAAIPPFSARNHTFVKGGGALENMVHAISSTSENPIRALDFLEYLNSKEGRLEANTGIEGVHWTNLTSDGYYDRLPQYTEDYGNQNYLPYHFYLGAHHMRGWIPAGEYSTFEDAYANINLIENRAVKGQLSSGIVALQEGAKWADGPHPFKFWTVPSVRDAEGEVQNAMTEGIVKLIAAPEGQFDSKYEEMSMLLKEANFGFWKSEWQKFYDANIK